MTCYRAVLFRRYSLGFNKSLLSIHTKEQALTLSALLCHIVEECRTFKTLPEHSVQIAEALKLPHERATVARLLDFAVAQGLLVAEEHFYRNIAVNNPHHDYHDPISTVAIVTANRVGPCMRALDSFIRNTTDFSRRVSFTIMDDSNCGEARAAYIGGLRIRNRVCSTCIA